MGAPTWSSYLDVATRDKALAIARNIAGTVRDPARLASIIAIAHEQSPMAEATAWRPHSLGGDAGLVLAFGYLDACFPGEGWQKVGHRHLEAAARGVERLAPAPLGMFGGLSGLGFGAAYVARGGPGYRRLLERIDERVAEGARSRARELRSRVGFHISAFDLVSGLAGMTTYLLCRVGRPHVDDAIRDAVSAMAALSSEPDGLPAWHTPGAVVAANAETLKAEYPDGYLDCGLAHGMPGVLMTLSLACANGVDVPGLRDAIMRFADWLLSHRRDDEWGVNWPPAVPLVVDGAGSAAPVAASASLGTSTARSGWCYGAPGVARALWKAGEALDEPHLRDAAVGAMRATLRRPASERRIDSPTFCHGVAGYLQCVLRFANDTALPEFAQAARGLTEQLIAMNDGASALGYRSVEMHGARVDQPGMVDGATGVMTTLLAAAVEVEPTWDRAFLVS